MRDRWNILAGGVLCLVLLSVFAGAQQVFSAERLKIVTFRPITDRAIQFAVKVQREAYRRLGYEIEFLVVPGKRASVMLESGEADGELGRPEVYGQFHPNLIRVEEPYAVVPMMAYVADPDLELNGWESLRGISLRVEYQRGMSNALHSLQGIVPPGLLSQVNTTEQGLKRLLVGRTDVYIDAYQGTGRVLKSESFQAFERLHGEGRRVRIAGAMGEIALYPWLNPKHANLAPRLAEVLREMKADGSFERFVKEVGGTLEDFRW